MKWLTGLTLSAAALYLSPGLRSWLGIDLMGSCPCPMSEEQKRRGRERLMREMERERRREARLRRELGRRRV